MEFNTGKLLSDGVWSDTELLPKFGNFSFIIDSNTRNYLTHDYNFFKTLKIYGYSILKEPKNFNGRILKLLRLNCFPYHTTETFQHSMLMLEYIINYGWTEFVINYLNCFSLG